MCVELGKFDLPVNRLALQAKQFNCSQNEVRVGLELDFLVKFFTIFGKLILLKNRKLLLKFKFNDFGNLLLL